MKLYMTAKKKREIENAYKKMGEDKEYMAEMKTMAEEGMEDYWNIIWKYFKSKQ